MGSARLWHNISSILLRLDIDGYSPGVQDLHDQHHVKSNRAVARRHGQRQQSPRLDNNQLFYAASTTGI